MDPNFSDQDLRDIVQAIRKVYRDFGAGVTPSHGRAGLSPPGEQLRRLLPLRYLMSYTNEGVEVFSLPFSRGSGKLSSLYDATLLT